MPSKITLDLPCIRQCQLHLWFLISLSCDVISGFSFIHAQAIRKFTYLIGSCNISVTIITTGKKKEELSS